MNKEETLTLKEALEQGYTHYCYGHPSNGYQSLQDLSDITESDIKDHDIYLADKETFSPDGIDNESLKDMIADHISSQHYDDTGDDTDTVYDAIKELDFSDVVKRIENKLSELNHYRWITEIKLVPEIGEVTNE